MSPSSFTMILSRKAAAGLFPQGPAQLAPHLGCDQSESGAFLGTTAGRGLRIDPPLSAEPKGGSELTRGSAAGSFRLVG